jgi:hypothetical protein
MSTDLPSQIQSELIGLDALKQRQVLAFVRSLKGTPNGITGAELKQFAGTLTDVDAKSMMEVIKAGCEQVDADGW